jgi:hypothetical protein
MSVKPVAISAVLGTPEHLRDPGKRPANHNRFSALRTRSPSVQGRSLTPTPATKRPNDDDTLPDGKNPRVDVFGNFMPNFEKKMAVSKDNICKLRASLSKAGKLDPLIIEILGAMTDTIEGLSDAVEAVASALVDSSAKSGRSGRPANSGPSSFAAAAAGKADRQTAQPQSAEEIRKKKFVAAVKDAEKSVLVFKLNLGKVSVMKKDNIAKKVTQDITAKAALAEGKTNGRPSEETIETLEDTLSLMKGMEFFGKATKPYTNRKDAADPENGTFCTLPVKMTFYDKDAKVRAQNVLRNSCKLQCTTPYPMNLRKMITQTMEAQKRQYPEQWVQVRVDAEKLALKISRRIDGKWHNDIDSIDLPDSALVLGNGATTAMDTDSSQSVVSQGTL